MVNVFSSHASERETPECSMRGQNKEGERTNGLSYSDLELHVLSDGGSRVVGSRRRALLSSEPSNRVPSRSSHQLRLPETDEEKEKGSRKRTSSKPFARRQSARPAESGEFVLSFESPTQTITQSPNQPSKRYRQVSERALEVRTKGPGAGRLAPFLAHGGRSRARRGVGEGEYVRTLTFFPSSFSFHSTMVVMPSEPTTSVRAGSSSARRWKRTRAREPTDQDEC
jgi:hypothetical protein